MTEKITIKIIYSIYNCYSESNPLSCNVEFYDCPIILGWCIIIALFYGAIFFNAKLTFCLPILFFFNCRLKIRVDNHIHLRHIMLYHIEKGRTAAQSFRDLNKVVVRRWFIRFKSGDTSSKDKRGRGRILTTKSTTLSVIVPSPKTWLRSRNDCPFLSRNDKT